jgi:TonB family protein
MSQRRVMTLGLMAAVVALWSPALRGEPAAASQTGSAGQLQRLTGAVSQVEPGPLERRARPITPENPIPRRVHLVAPQYPPEAASSEAAASITVRLTLDALGRVGEVRAVGYVLGASNVLTLPSSPEMPAILDAFAAAALTATRQWIYEPPVSGPAAFDVLIRFAPDADPQVVASGPSLVPATAPASAATQPLPTVTSEPAPPWADGVADVRSLPQHPARLTHVAPIYPQAAREAGIAGTVMLQARIEPDGSVGHARVLHSIPALDQAALDAVLQWQFAPTIVNGRAVPVLLMVTCAFSL